MKITLLAITPQADKVIEQAGRVCYLSDNKITDTSAKPFIHKLIKAGHESVLEHASATFKIEGVSRALTHQLVRHRLASFSQQSQRYVDENGFDFVIPESVIDKDEFTRDMLKIADMYDKWRKKGLKKEDARFVLPNACCSDIVVSANFREWRHIMKMRLSSKAQWEIRTMAKHILILLATETCVFDDFLSMIE